MELFRGSVRVCILGLDWCRLFWPLLCKLVFQKTNTDSYSRIDRDTVYLMFITANHDGSSAICEFYHALMLTPTDSLN